MSEIVFMFPGQSSRYPEMIEKITALSARSAATLRRASDVLGRDLAAHYRGSNPEVFATNRDVQIGVFLANHLHLGLLEEAGVEASWSIGLSLGEYNHLVHIGAISFEDALPLIDERGRLYDQSEGGLMVSLFPIDAAIVEQTIIDLGLTERAAVGLYNSPQQQVLSGERSAVERIVAALEQEHFIETVVIEPRIPMHAPVFAPVGEKLRAILNRARFVPPRLPYVPNAFGAVIGSARVEQIRRCLEAHAHRPVQWQRSVDAVAARLPNACFVEVGPRAILHNLFGRRWMPGRRAKTDSIDRWGDHLDGVIAELRHAS